MRVSQRDDDDGHSPEGQARALLKQAAAEGVTLAAAPLVEQAFRLRAGGSSVQAVREHPAANGIVRSHHGAQQLPVSNVVLGEIHFGSHTPNPAAHTAIGVRAVNRNVRAIRAALGKADENLAAFIEITDDCTDPRAAAEMKRQKRDQAQQAVDELDVPDGDELLALAVVFAVL